MSHYFEIEKFDMTSRELCELTIKESHHLDTCLIVSLDGRHFFNSFVLDRNTQTEILCEVTFYRSSKSNLYIPRLTFCKCKLNGEEKLSNGERIRIALDKGELPHRFWNLIGFLGKFKTLVDTGDFADSFRVVSKNYLETIKTLSPQERVTALNALLKGGAFSSNEIRSVVYESRKRALRVFLYLLKNRQVTNSQCMVEWYQSKHLCRGLEGVWHHFLKENDWILGLNIGGCYLSEIVDEAKVGMEDSTGSGSPRVDFLGYTDYMTLIELKTPETPLFKTSRGNGSRANTWEFSNEFISGISQCLGQKSSFDESYKTKEIISNEGVYVSKQRVYNKDAKMVFIIGCRNLQFPHDGNPDNMAKSNTFELFRRNNRNLEILTYDELFERTYFSVLGERPPKDWFLRDDFEIKR